MGEAYDQTLQASGGIKPYSWALIDGVLPAGLSLDATGHMTGAPADAGTASFTLQVTDAIGATNTRQFALSAISRLSIATPANLPSAAVGAPYTVALQAQGGATPYAWSVLGTGAYVETAVSPSGWLGGGTALGWNGDDVTWSLPLPWPFNFYGVDYTAVNVCSNGFLDFTSTAHEYNNSLSLLKSHVRIAPLWDDLTTAIGTDNIFLATTPDYVAVRWQAHTFGGR